MTKAKIKPNEPCWCGSGQKYKRCHREEDRATKGLFGRTAAILRGGLKPRKARPKPENPVRPGSVTPMRKVPDHIPRPDYAETGRPGSSRQSVIKTPEQIDRMRSTCRAARKILETVLAAVRPGITTEELDAIGHEAAIEIGAYPSPLNYHGYPKSICTSVNEVICHGIPDSRALREGDIVNCDITIFLDGVHGDCSETVLVGQVDEESRKLVEVTRGAMMAGIGAVRAGGRVRDIGRAIEKHVEPHGFSVVRAFVGHGIGETFHMDPQVPHYFDRTALHKLMPGMTFTIEPMINLGDWDHHMWSDNWTAVTCDLQRSAQFEHTILVREDGVEILTVPEDFEQPFLKS